MHKGAKLGGATGADAPVVLFPAPKSYIYVLHFLCSSPKFYI